MQCSKGEVDFGSADITSSFEAQGARFQNKEKEASFNSMKVGGLASFEKAVFEGPVSFISADIAGQFRAVGTKFQNKEKGASFSGMKVGGTVFISKAVFD